MNREKVMNINDNKTTTRVALDDDSSVVVARRRALLRGVGKGAAVLAAAAPIKTLAGQSLLTFDGKHQCSVSGQQSGVHSATPTNTPVCGGYSPGWWGQTDDGKTPRRTWPTDHRQKCKDVFSRSTLRNSDTNGSWPTLFQIMEPKEPISKFSNTDEFHWVCAWLNALSRSFNFPYSGQQVLDYYNKGKGSAAYEDALAFFKTYMETHTA